MKIEIDIELIFLYWFNMVQYIINYIMNLLLCLHFKINFLLSFNRLLLFLYFKILIFFHQDMNYIYHVNCLLLLIFLEFPNLLLGLILGILVPGDILIGPFGSLVRGH